MKKYILRVVSHEDARERLVHFCIGRDFDSGHAHDPFCHSERNQLLEHGAGERHELAAWDNDEAVRLAICLIGSEYGESVIARLEGPPAWDDYMPRVADLNGTHVTR